MYKCVICLKNKAEWIAYAENIAGRYDNITDDVFVEILTFPFEFCLLD